MTTQDLMDAVSRSDVPRAQRLLAHGVSPNAAPGFTGPLHIAVRDGDCRMVELLLFAGADPLLTDTWGLTALDHANGA
jgi:hypothetical protein